MLLLPSSMILKSNATGKFLCYGNGKGKDRADGTTTLSFSQNIDMNLPHEGDLPVDEPVAAAGGAGLEDFRLIKFEVEEAKTAPGFVHIRTCYNNKYWVRKSLESNSIMAEANEAEEDQSKPTCTLFKPVLVEEKERGEKEDEDDSLFANKHGIGKPPQKIQLIHVSQLGQLYVGCVENDNGRLQELTAAYSDNSSYFTAYDVQANVTIPARFTLMGNDGKYISGFSGFNLGFVTTDVGGTNVAQSAGNPTVPRYQPIWIDNRSLGTMPWTLNNYNDVCLTTGNITRTYFAPVKAGDDHIALHTYLTGNFVHRVNSGTYDGVTAQTMNTITDQARLRIGEPVLSRTISEPYYDLANARIYNTGDFQMYSDSRSNNTSIEQTGTFEVEYVKAHTTTWNQSVTVNIGVTFSMSVGVPFVGEAGIDMSTSITSSTEWGKSSTQEEIVRYTQNVTIPPRTKLTLKVLSNKSSCDVPFVCEVHDVMTDGTVRKYTKTDILFTGINSYNFETLITEERLP